MTDSDERRAESVGSQQQKDVWSAGMALGRSLFRLGLTVVTVPARMLPEETRQHLKAAGHEAAAAGRVLKREMLVSSEENLMEAHAQLDELEEKLQNADWDEA